MAPRAPAGEIAKAMARNPRLREGLRRQVHRGVLTDPAPHKELMQTHRMPVIDRAKRIWIAIRRVDQRRVRECLVVLHHHLDTSVTRNVSGTRTPPTYAPPSASLQTVPVRAFAHCDADCAKDNATRRAQEAANRTKERIGHFPRMNE